jgi:DNA-binding response OmpR family regulator
MSGPSGASRRILVIEDEFLIASEMAATLEEAGYAVVGPVGSVSAALTTLTGDDAKPDAAVVDANLRGESSAPLVARLRDLAVPFCVCTGYRNVDLKATFGDAPTLQKPIDPAVLLRTVSALAATTTAAPG